MRADSGIRVPEGFQQCDLTTLDRNQARKEGVEEKRRDTQENGGNLRRADLDLAELIGQKAIRRLILATVCIQPAIGREERVEGVENVRFGGSVSSAHHDVVNAPFMSKASPSISRLIHITPKRRLSGKTIAGLTS
jgi:hypothetical protein